MRARRRTRYFSTTDVDVRKCQQPQQGQATTSQSASSTSTSTTACVRVAWRQEARAFVASRQSTRVDVRCRRRAATMVREACACVYACTHLLNTRHDDAPLNADVTALHVDRFAQRVAVGMSNGSCAHCSRSTHSIMCQCCRWYVLLSYVCRLLM